MSGEQQVYAVIRARSKYRYQQPFRHSYQRPYKVAVPFPVRFSAEATRGGYGVHGNRNDYRVQDLNFFVRLDDSPEAPFVRLI